MPPARCLTSLGSDREVPDRFPPTRMYRWGRRVVCETSDGTECPQRSRAARALRRHHRRVCPVTSHCFPEKAVLFDNLGAHRAVHDNSVFPHHDGVPESMSPPERRLENALPVGRDQKPVQLQSGFACLPVAGSRASAGSVILLGVVRGHAPRAPCVSRRFRVRAASRAVTP